LPMSARDGYPHAVPCSVTCLAADIPAAMDFYGDLFGWTFETDAAVSFASGRLHGREVAAIGSLSEAGPDVRAAWITNVCVESAAAAAAQAPEAGGTLVAGPMDMAPAGHLAVLADPAGAVICAWEAAARKGAEVVNEPGAWAMSVLQTPDDGAAAFYGAMFGWETEAFGPVSLFRLPGYVGGEPEQPVPRDVVAAWQPRDEGAAQWAVDFWVADADAAAATTERGGGSVLEPPAEAGPFRRAIVADPEGASFSVSQLLLSA
jgi:predicted enzyme related to lactoylglutathione lyase